MGSGAQQRDPSRENQNKPVQGQRSGSFRSHPIGFDGNLANGAAIELSLNYTRKSEKNVPASQKLTLLTNV